MLSWIDGALNRITMYRLVLFGLGALAAWALALAFTGHLSNGGWPYVLSLLIVLGVSYGVNQLLAALVRAPVNPESTPITALILFFIMTPAVSGPAAAVLAAAAALAVASKYFLAPDGHHIANPAAVGAMLLGFLGFGFATWWVGSPWFLVPTLLLGAAVTRKVRHVGPVIVCLAVALVAAVVENFWFGDGTALSEIILQTLVSGPLIFFATIMLTEPETAAPTRRGRLLVAGLVGVLLSVSFRFGPIFSSPELALVLGNLVAYTQSLRRRLTLVLKEKRLIARDIWEFIFVPIGPLPVWRPGQYLELTMPHRETDARGTRRYFTIASASSEGVITLGIKFSEPSSTWKRALGALAPGARVAGGAIAGDFVLPTNAHQPLGFLAGGIGVTPFRSMVKDLVSRNESRDAVLIYAARSEADLAYRDLWSAVDWLRTTYATAGPLTAEDITRAAPDCVARRWYLSGPDGMVRMYTAFLRELGVPRRAIVTDYFPGF